MGTIIDNNDMNFKFKKLRNQDYFDYLTKNII